MNPAITLAMTGASGADYGLRLMQQLLKAGEQVYLLVSAPALIVINTETDLHLPSRPQEIQAQLTQHFQVTDEQLQVFGREQWGAPVASGTNVPRAMVVCPCTSGTLAGIAAGTSRNLIERAADVILKEQRSLILVHRDTPLSVIQLENMLRLARAGAVILPANPGFYYHPQQTRDLVDFVVARILDQLHIEHQLIPRWGEKDA
ncbi:flavin prenyltransferase UbiX [Candidatus Venteria ishoeyi]|uniref:Flavin prenyltransferase UbiX n=1 Tax=Candidatus Venteria ishoeyi TaxID=1899563 RepID=A0A1H6FGR1_9GAMM|nr:flavin prenyltransferase UbiX [Candidatus Venteria ishoeyi]MDM8546749.1 flavin prenyltransferase UbiX [Candidatus Venteria ishoeyi]SEH09119.1 putative aromatic acid decarboxylase [Candidatus Venteria ishoeyi]SEH09248.1 putative aromatic acid decarboxylase [Candidatus Venteria ishoeyi]